MKEITLVGQKKEVGVLKVNYDIDKHFTIPLAGEMSIAELKEINTRKDVFDFLCKHIPEEVQERMTVREYNQIMSEWVKASQEDGDIVLGESQASQGSVMNIAGQ